MTPLGSTRKPEPKPPRGWGASSPSWKGTSKKRRNSSGTWSSRGERRRLGLGLGRDALRALARDSILTTAGSTFLTTSRYDVISLGTAVPAGAWPFKKELARKVPATTPSTRQQTTNVMRFILGVVAGTFLANS